MRKALENWVYSAWKGEAFRHLIVVFQCLKGADKKDREGLFKRDGMISHNGEICFKLK